MYGVHLLTVAALYVILASGANVAVGYTGLVSLGQAALYAAGAYTSTLLVVDLGVSFGWALTSGVAVAAALATLMSVVLLRLGDDYFVVATIGFQFIVWSVLNNYESLTRGPLGITGVPAARLLSVDVSAPLTFFALATAAAVSVVWACQRLVDSPYGRVLRAIREDPTLTLALGKRIDRYKITAMAFGGATAGLAGALYAPFLGFVDPTGFTLAESLLILSMVIIGGAGRLAGPVVGALLLVLFPELLRFLGLPATLAANVRQILYGGLLVLTMVFRPQGMLGSYRFQRHDQPAL